MRSFTGGAASLLIGLGALGQPVDTSAVAQPEPITARHPELKKSETESERVSRALEAMQENWSFLATEATTKLRAILEGIKLPGLTAQPIEQVNFPSYRIITSAKFRPDQSRGPVTISEVPALQAEVEKQLDGLAQLRKEGHLAMTKVVFLVTQDGALDVAMLSFGGARSSFKADPGVFALGPEDQKKRQEIWGSVISSIDLTRRLAAPLGPAERSECLQSLEGLRGYYAGSGEDRMAALAQCLMVYVAPNASTIRQYADMGRIDENDPRAVIPQFAEMVREVNRTTRNVLSPKDIVALGERVKEISCPPLPLALLALEQEAQIYPASVVSLAHLEIRDAIRFAQSEWQASKQQSPAVAGEIVRRYFEEYFKNEYNFGDVTPGLSAGISLRRTDCSTRAVLAFEQLSSMGLVTGTETILAYKDGKPLPGVAAHIYNFIDVPGSGRIYFDFCRKQGEEYCFASSDSIKEQYVGGLAGIEVRVEMSSTKAEDLYGQLVREPILKQLNVFCSAFRAHGGNVSEFLLASPEYIPVMHLLCAYSSQVDRIFGKKEMEAWRIGTQESLASIYEAQMK